MSLLELVVCVHKKAFVDPRWLSILGRAYCRLTELRKLIRLRNGNRKWALRSLRPAPDCLDGGCALPLFYLYRNVADILDGVVYCDFNHCQDFPFFSHWIGWIVSNFLECIEPPFPAPKEGPGVYSREPNFFFVPSN